MKERCDNQCETCPMQTQLHCAVVYSKAAYVAMGKLMERVESVEKKMQPEIAAIINPLAPAIDNSIESVKLPTQEVGGNLI